MSKPLAVVIMAAGKGTRMKNPDMAKVMYQINGKPMIEYVVDLAFRLQSQKTVVIVGWQKESVIEHLASAAKQVACVEQSPQLGTGHAVMQAEEPLRDFDGDVLVLSGDVPMLTLNTVKELVESHRRESASATVLTAILADATGYGRVVRDGKGNVTAIVEHKDSSEEQRAIKEVNSGIYLFDRLVLFDGLRHVTPNNVQKEYYLTDVFDYFRMKNFKVCAVTARNPHETRGINTVQDLE
ncbi:MAG: UDP-N-acetylglucosamine pyrophosphorylase, partial [Bacteroidetes bacterium]|nr:UDP-N-acetylglucosamine pyrophosphorylase [Bacteroidota bacterium]